MEQLERMLHQSYQREVSPLERLVMGEKPSTYEIALLYLLKEARNRKSPEMHQAQGHPAKEPLPAA